MEDRNFYTDHPITGDDNSPDLLNREEYARQIGHSIIVAPGSDGLVVSIEGSWGYGKTSVMNLIKKSFRSQEKKTRPIIVDFNPWLIGNAENLAQEFLIQFASEIGIADRGKELKGVAKQVLAYSKIFTVLKLIPGAGQYAELVEKVFEKVGEAGKNIGELKELNFNEKRKNVIESLKQIKNPILVFIDDLDRLLPAEVFQMLRVIKAIADFPSTTYVLGFESTYIEQALDQHGIKDASLYLDKIVQCRFHLPKINELDLHNIFEKEFERSLTGELQESFDRDRENFIDLYCTAVKPILKSPREIKRILNKLKMVAPVIHREVAFSDIFGLEVLAIKAPAVYEHIHSEPVAYTGIPLGETFTFDPPKEYAEKFRKVREEKIKKSQECDRKYIEKIIHHLFPLTDSAGFNLSHPTYGRVASTDRLMIALSYGLPTEEVADYDVREYLQNPKRRDEIADQIIQQGKLDRFLELLMRRIDDFLPEDAEVFLQKLGNFVNSGKFKKIQEHSDRVFSFSFTPLDKVWLITQKLLQKNPDNRVEMIKKLITQKDCLMLATEILKFLLHQHGFYSEKDSKPESECLCDNTTVDELKALWLTPVEAVFKDKSIFGLTDPASVIFLLRRLDSPLAKKLIAPLWAKDDDLDQLVKAFGKSGSDSEKGAFTQIDESFLDEIGDKKKIRERVKKRLDSNEVTEPNLKAIYQSILTGESFYLIDGSKRIRP